MRKTFISLIFILGIIVSLITGKEPVPQKPRIIVSTDIGGTDCDDYQSVLHLLMYSDLFDIEGIISNPTVGKSTKGEILRMIDSYEEDYPYLKKYYPNIMTPSSLRKITKEGHIGIAPYNGYSEPNEGSKWIVKRAREKIDERPLWILAWGTLEDVAQALHDAPDIENNIKVYFIGGPNKKWGVNSYSFIVKNFPNLWMIECNGSYFGFITYKKWVSEETGGDYYNFGYYDNVIKGSGKMAEEFLNYCSGNIKMGDTPSLLYMMDGDPEDPIKESWGGSFIKIKYSSRRVIDINEHQKKRNKIEVPVCSVIEFNLKGPIINITDDIPSFNITIAQQTWQGYYLGDGNYGVKYCPKQPDNLTYITESDIPELNNLTGNFSVGDIFPGTHHKDDYTIGNNWYTDKPDRDLYEDQCQGAKTIRKWRKDSLIDWEERWKCLKEELLNN